MPRPRSAASFVSKVRTTSSRTATFCRSALHPRGSPHSLLRVPRLPEHQRARGDKPCQEEEEGEEGDSEEEDQPDDQTRPAEPDGEEAGSKREQSDYENRDSEDHLSPYESSK